MELSFEFRVKGVQGLGFRGFRVYGVQCLRFIGSSVQASGCRV